jgi:hypothetical protein
MRFWALDRLGNGDRLSNLPKTAIAYLKNQPNSDRPSKKSCKMSLDKLRRRIQGMTVLDKVLSKMQTLPTDQQQQVLRFVEFLTVELGDRQVNQESENLKEGQRKSNFWKGLQKFRLTIQNERVGFTNEDFADLRDRSVGREIIL